MNVTFRPARPDEGPTLTELAFASKRHWGYPEEWIELWRQELTFSSRTLEDLAVVVAEEQEEGRPVAVYALKNKRDRSSLEHFWVHPDVMGRGVGRRMLAHARETARSRGATVMEVVSDPNAEGFYRKAGGQWIGEVAATPRPRRLPFLLFPLSSSR